MENFLKKNGFREDAGVWYRVRGRMTFAVFIEECGGWSCGVGRSKTGALVRAHKTEPLFFALPEDQAKESIEHLVSVRLNQVAAA